MADINDAMKLIRRIAMYKCEPFSTIHLGSLPIEEALIMDLATSTPVQQFMDRTSDNEVLVRFNGKSADRDKVLTAMNNVHRYLTQEMLIPIREPGICLYYVETAVHPTFSKRELSEPKQFVYTSTLRMKMTLEGGNC